MLATPNLANALLQSLVLRARTDVRRKASLEVAAFHTRASQRSLHNAPIFRFLLKVAVNGTHQCDYSILCEDFGPQPMR